MKITIDICPYCNGSEFIEGKQSGYAAIQGEGALTSTPLKYSICRTCGTVVRTYVDDPEKLLKMRNRKDNKNEFLD